MTYWGIYPEGLTKLVQSVSIFIPRRIRNGEHLRMFHRYWTEELGEFKVKDCLTINEIEYYFVSMYESERQAVLTYPISADAKCYELLKNFNSIENDSVINNRTKSFTGAEIRFWFCVNRIDFSDEENYRGFLKELQYNRGLKDSRKYMVRRNKKQNIFEFIEQDEDFI